MAKAIDEKEETKRRGCGCFGCLGIIILIGSCAKNSDNDKSDKAATTIKQEETKKSEESKEGEKIYHMPGQQFYDKTKAEEMFCSEADAKSAGYRASKK
ncbi:hypothetical protein COO17_31135 [Bacillus wiedmannii]|uniref:Lipoprotein n=1 Tax=Bacillus wiedmannii TaxID=1890302 RepID=A0A2A7BI78_9BACI|nr:hypothetical protein [Bacillus wiedmannii]PDY32284.1 hypothetical protein COO17_31135 [Bacillus wiedmannii]